MRSLILFLLACAASLPALSQPPAFLLPDGVSPKRHIIELTIDPARDAFDGWARIEVEISKPTNTVWVNAKDITPHETSIEWQGKTLAAQPEVAGGEFLGLQIGSPIGPGRATLSIRYEGKLDEKSVVGPYRKNVNGEWYVFTTFTPIDARRAFPCFDEPRFKTPWEMSIRIKREHKAFANGRELREINEPNGMKLVRFAPTESLPAEVVAFCVGPFDVYEGASAGHNTPIRVISLKGQRDQSKAAAQATVDVLPRLEAYTGIPYPFGKLDHVALPEGAFGAVENPGLITYRARGLLIPPGEEAPERIRSIRSLQAHEIGHQWFGDMVTQATWDDVWLSEGFATWFSAKVMDQEQPPARKLLFSVAARERIMAADAGPRTRPVRLPMNSRNDTRNVYNQIVYQKGAAILVMLDGWLGEDKVRDGLRAYLKQHKFANATTTDLETALRASSGKDPAPMMNSFLNQTGIPVIDGDIHCDGGRLSIALAQRNTAHQWSIPVCWRAEGIERTCTIVDSKPQEVVFTKGGSCPAWIYLNAGGTGYYRSEFNVAQLATLAYSLSALTPAERLTLIYDLRAANQRQQSGGRKPEAITLLTKLSEDSEPEVAKAASDLLAGK